MKRLMTTLALVATLAAACGSSGTTSEATSSPPPSTTAAVSTTTTTVAATTTAAATTTVASGPPERIVSLSPTATEILFAIGAGDQVVAVDTLSNYPAGVPTSDLSAFQPNVEAIAEFEPDFVVTSYDPGDLIDGLKALGIVALTQGSAFSLSDTYSQIEELGSATGHEQESAALIEQVKSELVDLIDTAPDGAGVTYFHEIDNTLYTATSSTFIGEIYAMFGMENIADVADSDGSAFGFPQLSNEYVIDANPDIIFLSDSLYSGENAESVGARPGWRTISAVANGNIVVLDDDIASRWSPRVVKLAAEIAAALARVVVPA